MSAGRGARAGEVLVGPQRVYFLDEVTTGLDSATAHQVVSVLRDLAHLESVRACLLHRHLCHAASARLHMCAPLCLAACPYCCNQTRGAIGTNEGAPERCSAQALCRDAGSALQLRGLLRGPAGLQAGRAGDRAGRAAAAGAGDVRAVRRRDADQRGRGAVPRPARRTCCPSSSAWALRACRARTPRGSCRRSRPRATRRCAAPLALWLLRRCTLVLLGYLAAPTKGRRACQAYLDSDTLC